MTYKVTIFANDPEDHPSDDYLWVEAWLAKWDGKVVVAEYSSGGWEHLWNVAGPKEAVDEIPEELLCASEWTNFKIRSKA